MSDPLQAAALLLILECLFALRVAGQLLVRLRAPAWLPPMDQWASGLVPYPLLLGIQVVTLILMGAVALGVAVGWPRIAPAPAASCLRRLPDGRGGDLRALDALALRRAHGPAPESALAWRDDPNRRSSRAGWLAPRSGDSDVLA